METEIYYFSGTGNSLFIAKELQKRLPASKLIPIASLLATDEKVIRTKGTTVGLVFPVHALTIPIAVKRFVERTDFSSTEYLFAIATRDGTVFRGFEKIDRILENSMHDKYPNNYKNKKTKLDSHFIINMYNNESRHKGYAVPAETDILSLEKAASEKIGRICEIISGRLISCKKDTECDIGFGHNPVVDYILEKTVLAGMTVSEYIGGVNYFYHDANCNGCGICEKVCLSGKIRMADDRPAWQKGTLCYMCFACLNFCPKRSVQIKDIPGVKSYTTVNSRYTHPYATIDDISAQKRKT